MFISVQILFRKSNYDALVKSQKSHILIISEEIRIQSLQIVVSVFSVRSVANCTFYVDLVLQIAGLVPIC